MSNDDRIALKWRGHTDDHVTVTVDGLTTCLEKDCGYEKYDPYWGAGLFTDWPRGTTKPYGA